MKSSKKSADNLEVFAAAGTAIHIRAITWIYEEDTLKIILDNFLKVI